MVLPLFFAYVYISIHVPSWGTTTDSKYLTSGDYLFQSTFPRGERQHTIELIRELQPFQSTFPRGERPKLEHKV